MLVRGNILLAILLAGAVIAAPVKEIQKDVVNGDELKNRELQSRYGVQPHYPGARQYKEARQYVTDEPTQSPTLSPFYEAPTQTRTGYRGTVYTDEDGRTYVIRRRNGVENKVYTDTPGWDQGGRGYRQRQRNGGTRVRNGNGARVRNGNRVRVRNGNGNRRRWGGGAARPARKKKNNNWSPPTPVKDNDWSPPTPQVEDWSPPTPKPTAWRPDGWRPIPTYQGDYNPSYRQTDEPTELEPTEVPTWDNDGYSGGKCDEVSKTMSVLYTMHRSKQLSILINVFSPFSNIYHNSHSSHLAAFKVITTHLIKSKIFARNSAVTTTTVILMTCTTTRMMTQTHGALQVSLLMFLPGVLMVMFPQTCPLGKLMPGRTKTSAKE